MNAWLSRDVRNVLGLALLTRLASVVVTTATSLNSYAHGDADLFAEYASTIATTIGHGQPPDVVLGETDEMAGLFLAPFWFLPGPSRLYARLGIAILGTISVYNVYVIARYYHSHRAGLLATIPFLVYPSILFIHSVILREVFVLFGLTTAARLLLAPSDRLSPTQRYGAVVVALAIAWIQRQENLVIYLLALAVAGVVRLEPWRRAPRLSAVTAAVGATLGPVLALPYARAMVDRLARLRKARARDRTKYLDWVFPETVPEAIAFSWLGAIYFLFTPFPWMVETAADFVVSIEAIVNLGYAIFAVHGTRVLARETLPGAGGLAVGIVAGSILYGLATANVGTAVRHRQMVLWAIFLLGGIGMANLIDVRGLRS